ncbi:hypothetical protein J7438_02730 [Thalassotalea sp. G20_0]|uniref:hypothetical protein n=1 Tax=Thalassotalea sp. G20_0 TaxID=2821093 RepID=UPI001AD99EB8|nr:hypothetical protein [Thalassotalea sp. G20_0]MBO9493007.1 hypothetical protein [Thalassotalea sp. G20_0]
MIISWLLNESQQTSPDISFYWQNTTRSPVIRTISDSNYPADIANLDHVIRPANIAGNPMKPEANNRPTLRSTSNSSNAFSLHRSTINSVKPLLKASATLPVTKSFDETGGYIKGYN